MIGTSDGKQYESEVNYHLGIELGDETDHSKSMGPVTQNKNNDSTPPDYEDNVWDLHNPEHRQGLRDLMDSFDRPSTNIEDVRDKQHTPLELGRMGFDKATDAIMAAGRGLNTAIDKTESGLNTLADSIMQGGIGPAEGGEVVSSAKDMWTKITKENKANSAGGFRPGVPSADIIPLPIQPK